MSRQFHKTVIVFFLAVFSLCVYGQEHHDANSNETTAINAHASEEFSEGGKSLENEIQEDIEHHLADSHYFDIAHDKKTHTYYGFPLPVILVDNGIKIFMSSEFEHGEKIVEKAGNYYVLTHGKIYKTDAQGNLEYNEKHEILNEKPLDLSITKTVFSIILASLILILTFISVAKSYTKSALPKGMSSFIEPFVIYIRDEIAIPNIGKKNYKKYMGFLLTIFFFIWTLNVLGLTPFGINVTGNISITFTLALFTFLITNLSGNKHYWGHLFNPLGNNMPWFAKIPIYIILIPIEIVGLIVKPFSLLIRLYANITAGHIVMMSLIGLIFIFKNISIGSISFVLAVAISLIEFFVAMLQAYIFTMLSALYLGMAVEEHEEH